MCLQVHVCDCCGSAVRCAVASVPQQSHTCTCKHMEACHHMHKSEHSSVLIRAMMTMRSSFSHISSTPERAVARSQPRTARLSHSNHIHALASTWKHAIT